MDKDRLKRAFIPLRYRRRASTRMPMQKLLVSIFLITLFTAGTANAACIYGIGVAGQGPPYLYAVAFINSFSATDTGLKGISAAAKNAEPTDDNATALVRFSQLLKEYELAARDFDCAASLLAPQEQFFMGPSNDLGTELTKMARETATAARLINVKLAKTSREIASIAVSRMRGTMGEVDFAQAMAAISANLHDLPRQLFSVAVAVPDILVDPMPDSSNRMSRLRITKKERDDLIDT